MGQEGGGGWGELRRQWFYCAFNNQSIKYIVTSSSWVVGSHPGCPVAVTDQLGASDRLVLEWLLFFFSMEVAEVPY